MSWIDKVPAVPTVGCFFQPDAMPATTYLEALRPLINQRLQEDGKTQVRMPGPLQLEVLTAGGFKYAISYERVTVEFNYLYELDEPPGEMPKLSFKVPVQKFTDLLHQTIEHEVDILERLLKNEPRPLSQVGIVASCRIDTKTPPPGVEKFIKHLSQPWGSPLMKCDAHLLAVLRDDGQFRDKCHHKIATGEDAGSEVKLILDWQRAIANPLHIRANKIREEMEKCERDALEYFEKFGRGELEYGSTG